MDQRERREMKWETWQNWREPVRVSWEEGASNGYKRRYLLPIKQNQSSGAILFSNC
ncbi:unnamed protein product [Prunus brigantina]